MTLRLYLGERQASATQYYESLQLVVSQAFGGKSTGKSKPSPKDTNHEVVTTREDMMRALGQHFGG